MGQLYYNHKLAPFRTQKPLKCMTVYRTMGIDMVIGYRGWSQPIVSTLAGNVIRITHGGAYVHVHVNKQKTEFSSQLEESKANTWAIAYWWVVYYSEEYVWATNSNLQVWLFTSREIPSIPRDSRGLYSERNTIDLATSVRKINLTVILKWHP